MGVTTGKKVHTVLDIWPAYVRELLKDYPGAWTGHKFRPNTNNHYYHNFYVYRMIGGKKVEIASYSKFRKIVEHYFDRAKSAVIKGEAIDIYGGVGKICMRRVERDFRKPKQSQIDWGATKKQPLVWSEAKGKLCYKTIIYFTGDDWVRVGWNRNKRIKNEKAYEFKPAATSSIHTTGFTLELVNALKKDELLRYQYLYVPKTP